MIHFRSFRNTDPPALCEIWRSQPPRRGLVSSLSPMLLDRYVLSKPYFDREGLIVAEDDDRPIGFAHAGFGPEIDLNSYVTTLAPNLSPQSKALVVKLVFHTMSASSELRPGHQKQLTKLGDTLGIPQDQYMDLIDLLSEPSDEN